MHESGMWRVANSEYWMLCRMQLQLAHEHEQFANIRSESVRESRIVRVRTSKLIEHFPKSYWKRTSKTMFTCSSSVDVQRALLTTISFPKNVFVSLISAITFTIFPFLQKTISANLSIRTEHWAQSTSKDDCKF